MVEGQKLEQDGPGELLPLEVTVLVIGPKGVGKSSTINSLLGENRAPVSHTGEHSSQKACRFCLQVRVEMAHQEFGRRLHVRALHLS